MNDRLVQVSIYDVDPPVRSLGWESHYTKSGEVCQQCGRSAGHSSPRVRYTVTAQGKAWLEANR